MFDEKALATLTEKFKEAAASAIKEQVPEMVNASVEAKVKAMIEQIDLSKVIAGMGKSGLSLAHKKEFAEKLKALSEGTTTAGGYLVPQEIQQGIARIVEDFGLVRKFATKFTMNEQILNLPRLTSSVTVYWPGENTAGTASDPVLGNVALTAKTAVALTAVSNELLADANISVTDWLMTIIAEAIAGEEDNQGLAGSGSPFTGILTDANVTIVTPAAGNSTFTLCTTADNLRDLISQIKPTALSGAAFIMHRLVLAIAQKQKDTAGNYIVTQPTPAIYGMGAEAPVLVPAAFVWNYPVYLSEKMPFTTGVSTKYVIFGNLKNLFFGDRQGMTMDISDAATVGGINAFAANQKVLRVTERIAIAVGLPTAFAVLRTSAT